MLSTVFHDDDCRIWKSMNRLFKCLLRLFALSNQLLQLLKRPWIGLRVNISNGFINDSIRSGLELSLFVWFQMHLNICYVEEYIIRLCKTFWFHSIPFSFFVLVFHFRSMDHVRRSMRDLSAYNLGSSSEIDNGYPYQKVTPVSHKLKMSIVNFWGFGELKWW